MFMSSKHPLWSSFHSFECSIISFTGNYCISSSLTRAPEHGNNLQPAATILSCASPLVSNWLLISCCHDLLTAIRMHLFHTVTVQTVTVCLFWKKISLRDFWSVFFVNSVKIDDDDEIVDFEKNWKWKWNFLFFQAFGHSPSSGN